MPHAQHTQRTGSQHTSTAHATAQVRRPKARAPRRPLGYIPAISRLYPGCISAISRLYLGYITHAAVASLATSTTREECTSADRQRPPRARPECEAGGALARAGPRRLRAAAPRPSPSTRLELDGRLLPAQATPEALQRGSSPPAPRCARAAAGASPLMSMRRGQGRWPRLAHAALNAGRPPVTTSTGRTGTFRRDLPRRAGLPPAGLPPPGDAPRPSPSTRREQGTALAAPEAPEALQRSCSRKAATRASPAAAARHLSMSSS